MEPLARFDIRQRRRVMTMGRRIGRSRIVCAKWLVALAAGAIFPAGCDQAASFKQGNIQIPFESEDGVFHTHCHDYASDVGPGWFTSVAFNAAAEANQESVELRAAAGALLQAVIESNDARLEFLFFLEKRDDGRVALERSDVLSAALANGRMVYVDLADANTSEWFYKASDNEIRDIRSLGLGGTSVDEYALKRLAGRQIAVRMNARGWYEPVFKALKACRPEALVIASDSIYGPANLSPKALMDLTSLGSLRYLEFGAGAVSDLGRLKRLRCLKFHFVGDEKSGSLAALSHLPHLEHLELGGCDAVEDFSVLSRLGNLRSLAMWDCKGLKDLQPIAGLTKLRMLFLSGHSLENLSGLERLSELRRLGLIGLPPKGVDLTPIHHLKKLEVLLVTKQDMEDANRQQDIEAIREAIPGVKVVGICMGSAWALVAAALGAAAGAGFRWPGRRRGRRA
jgi:hypothetical protein